MAAHDYLTPEALRKTLSLGQGTFAEDDVLIAISAASRVVDAITGRRFWLDDGETTRIYTPTRPRHLDIDDLSAEPTEVAVDYSGTGDFTTSWTLGRDYVLEPANAIADGVPFEVLELREGGRYSLPRRRQSMRISGIYGWPEIPVEVVQSTGLLANKLVRRSRDAVFGIVSFGIDRAAAMRIAGSDNDVLALLERVTRELILA